MGKGWWDWPNERAKNDADLLALRAMAEDERKAAIQNLADKCVVLDKLSPNVKVLNIRTAVGQFGTVRAVKMVEDPWDSSFHGVAIAEMGNRTERDAVVQQLREYLFMVGGIPRPVRAIPATPALLFDHPFRRSLRTLKFVKRSDVGSSSLVDRERKQQQKADDEVLLEQLMEQEEMRESNSQETICRNSMERLLMLRPEAGNIAAVRDMYGLVSRRQSFQK